MCSSDLSAAADAALAGHDGVAPIDTSSVVTDIVQPPAGGDGGRGDTALSSASSAGASSDASTVSSATGTGASSDGSASPAVGDGGGDGGSAPGDTNSVVTASAQVDQLGSQAALNGGEGALIPEDVTLVLSGVGSARTIASIVSSDLPDDQKALQSAAAAASFASQAVGATTPLGEGLGAAGVALDVAAIALSDMPDEQKAFRAAQTVLTMAAPPLAIPSIVGFAVEELVNLGLGEYQQGDISKAIMNAKQTALYQYGNQAQEEALKSAPDFNATLRALSAAPPGTSGQVQFGVGNEYAGETLVGQAGTTQTPGWESTLQRISDPTVIAQHPDLVASFIQNLWVQTGPSGAAAFNPGATRNYQTYLLSKLPYTPEWNAARQKRTVLEFPVNARPGSTSMPVIVPTVTDVAD